jgi:hypothetical protein
MVRRQPIYALILACLPLALIGITFMLHRPDLIPLIILTTAAFVPLSLPTGTESRLVFSLLLTLLSVGIWVFRMLAVEKTLRLRPSPVNKPLLGFSLITTFSLFWSLAFRDPLVPVWASFPIVQVASTVVMIMLPGAFLLVANYVKDQKSLKVLMTVMLVAGVLGLVRQYKLAPLPVNTGGLFTMWIVTLSTSLALFIREITRVRRALLLLLGGTWVIWGFILHTDWLAGWLPGLIAVGVLSFLRSKKLFLILLLCMLAYAVVQISGLENTFAAENQISGQTRMSAWEVNWRVTSKHLLLGTGPAGYTAYYMYYFPTEGMATHSNYIDILAETGIFGLGMLIWFFAILAWRGYKLCVRLKGRGDFLEGLAQAGFAGTIGCIVAMAFGDWLFPFAYTQTIAGFDYAVYNWLFMGTILVVDRLTQATPETATNA